MRLIGLVRLGRDVEVRYLQDGTPVASLSGAWNYGRPGEDNKKPTQWADLALWGDRADKLAPHLVKGRVLHIIAGDVHIETYTTRDGGTGAKLVGRVESLDFAGPAPGDQQQGQQQGQQRAPAAPQQRAQAPAAAPRPAPRQTGGSGFDDMDDDIPF